MAKPSIVRFFLGRFNGKYKKNKPKIVLGRWTGYLIDDDEDYAWRK